MKESFIVCYVHPEDTVKLNIGNLNKISEGGGYCTSEHYSVGNGIEPDFLDLDNPKPSVSFAMIKGGVLKAKCDYWGIHPFYYYHQNSTFIISNSIYSIKQLLGQCSNDTESFFDFLFFSIPLGGKTWFKDIKCLQPNQSIIWDNVSKRLDISEANIFSDLLQINQADSIGNAVDMYFGAISSAGKEIALSISSGSDSRTLLACLRYYDIKHTCFCFGKDNYAEFKNTEAFLDSLGERVNYVKLSESRSSYFEWLDKAIFQSNGLINPLRIHYYDYYNQLPADSDYMEGILGSEFVKGEISCPTMTSYPMVDVLFGGFAIAEVITRRFPFLSLDEQTRFSDYLKTSYSDLLIYDDSTIGINNYAKFLFNTLPSSVFGGIIQLATMRFSTFYPYTDKGILSAILGGGYGITHYSSLSKKFPGTNRSIIPEALIVKSTDRTIYRSVLDRGISFADSFSSLAHVKKKARNLVNRFKHQQSLFYGQIDNTPVKQWINDVIDEKALRYNSREMTDEQKRMLWYYNKTVSMGDIVEY